MWLAWLLLSTALTLSVIAAWYSIVGITAIFAGAVIPVAVMGSSLEIAKIVTTVWLHHAWQRAEWWLRTYLSAAVLVLMLLTSMGIFGFLSKAHSDQSLVSGDVTSKVALLDEKIRIARENIDANRAALKQLDAGVDQTLSRSTTEQGAERSVQIRRQQGPERTRLLRDIETEQKKIAQLNEERAPIAAEVRKVEAEVGPIKYIAALIYGDDPEANLLERAVRWVIILIVAVFDPLALMLMLAAARQFQWSREQPVVTDAAKHSTAVESNQHNINDHNQPTVQVESEPHEMPVAERAVSDSLPLAVDQSHTEISTPVVPPADLLPNKNTVRQRMRDWKSQNPNSSLKEQRQLLTQGRIAVLPWLQLTDKISWADTVPSHGESGEIFIHTALTPNQAYQWHENTWHSIGSPPFANLLHNPHYIQYLEHSVSNGTLALSDLSRPERDRISTTSVKT